MEFRPLGPWLGNWSSSFCGTECFFLHSDQRGNISTEYLANWPRWSSDGSTGLGAGSILGCSHWHFRQETCLWVKFANQITFNLQTKLAFLILLQFWLNPCSAVQAMARFWGETSTVGHQMEPVSPVEASFFQNWYAASRWTVDTASQTIHGTNTDFPCMNIRNMNMLHYHIQSNGPSPS